MVFEIMIPGTTRYNIISVASLYKVCSDIYFVFKKFCNKFLYSFVEIYKSMFCLFSSDTGCPVLWF